MKRPCACGCKQLTNGTYVRGHHWRVKGGGDINPNPSGLCGCDCGGPTPIATRTMRLQGTIEGFPLRFIPGHQSRKHLHLPPPNPSGICSCGQCGLTTEIADRSDPEDGVIYGQRRRYVKNHHGRKEDYMVEDRGWTTPCWIWQKHLDKNGYGRCTVYRTMSSAHRYYYWLHKGAIPSGYEVDHLCHVRACINPGHLEAVPAIVNNRRKLNAKLTLEMAREIRSLHAQGRSYTEIMAMFCVCRMTVSHVVLHRTWKEAATLDMSLPRPPRLLA